MKVASGILLASAVAFAGALTAGTAARAASLMSGKKLEIVVDPKNMDAERKALWDRFGGWCAIKDWHPAVTSCEESTEDGAKVRVLTLKDGGTIKEKMIDEQPNLYRYEMIEGPLPVKNYQAQFALTPDDDDEDEINFAWSATYDADGKSDKEARDAIDGIFKSGLDNIKALVAKK
jgi:hypothetical protein